MPPDDFDLLSDDADQGDEGATFATVPAFEVGGRVERTGIALVHEGEYIMPAPGSEATLSPAGASQAGGQIINFYFPVEVEVVGELDDAHMSRIARYVFEALDTALRSRA